MDAWRNGKQFVSLLERKKEILVGHIIKIENRLSAIRKEIEEHQREQTYINQQIKLLTPSGILARADIYKGIRRQGSLLAHLQMVMHKVTQLEDEQHKHQNILAEYRSVMSELDKRHYKLKLHLHKQQRIYYQRLDNNIENEIQEMAIYDRKKF